MKLVDIAHARSGDKGDRADIGLFAGNAEDYAIIKRLVTAERIAAHFKGIADGPVELWPLDNLWAIKIVLNGALQGNAARSLRSDNLENAGRGAAAHGDRQVQRMNIRSEKQGSVTTVIIDRPQAMNAIDRAAALALADAFRAFDADPQARVAVLCGEGGTFCAGADLKAFLANPDEWQVPEDGDAPLGPTRMLLGKPVIAAVSGHAVAGGLELALWADLRVVEESAVFGVFCRRWGVPLIDGGTVRLARLIGHSRALDMLLTGRPVKSAELAFGLPIASCPMVPHVLPPRRWPRKSPPSHRPACATTGFRATSNGACPCPMP